MAAHEVHQRRRRAFVRHMRHFDVGRHREQFRAHLAEAADARRTIGQLIRTLTRQRDQFLDVFCRHRRVHQQHAGCCRQMDQRCEVGLHVVGQLREVRRDRPTADGRDDEGVAVSRRTRGDFHADRCVGAGAVVEDHRLAETRGQAFVNHAPLDVGGTARREGHNEAERFGGPGLGHCRGRCNQCCRQQGTCN